MRKTLSRLYLTVVLIFLYVPILVLVVYSFNESKSRAGWAGFSLVWYRKLFNNEQIISALINTVIIAFVSSILATAIGTLAAIGINRMKKLPKTTVMNITYIPIINPEIITGVSLMLLFRIFTDYFNFQMGFLSLIIAHITFNIPYVIYSVIPKLRQMNPFLIEAAQDLGCNERQAFFKVVIPEIIPGVLSGFLLVLTYSIDDFVVSYFTSGTKIETLPITIAAMTRKRVSPEINALSAIIFTVVLIVLLIKNFLNNKKIKEQKLRKKVDK